MTVTTGPVGVWTADGYRSGVTANPRPRRSPFARFAFDRDGRLRGWRVLAMAAITALVLTIGGLTAAVLAGTGSPEALAIWATVAFVGIKLPVMALLWWLLGRSEHDAEDATLPDAQAAAAIERLRRYAADATATDDAWDRLDGLAAEAGYVAAHASPNYASEARLLRLDLLSARDRERTVT